MQHTESIKIVIFYKKMVKKTKHLTKYLYFNYIYLMYYVFDKIQIQLKDKKILFFQELDYGNHKFKNTFKKRVLKHIYTKLNKTKNIKQNLYQQSITQTYKNKND